MSSYTKTSIDEPKPGEEVYSSYSIFVRGPTTTNDHEINSDNSDLTKQLQPPQSRFDTRWQNMFKLLVHYKIREGHCCVSKGHIEHNEKLGYWVLRQRQYKKEGTLEKYRADLLNSIGFTWMIRKYTRRRPSIYRKLQWEAAFQMLLKFKDREGHCDVPYLHEEEKINLGPWVKDQRKKKKNGTLQICRMKRLESAGFVWDMRQILWNRNFHILQEFCKREGHCVVPQGHIEHETKLGAWLRDQRQRKRSGKLSRHRIKRFEELPGFVWRLRKGV